MGGKEEETPPKLQKEQAPPSSPATVFPDWAAFQAYYNSAGPPVPAGFYPSPVASSPQAHPYMWAPQHMVPPYATPTAPYVAMYPPGGLYPQSTMPAAGLTKEDGKSGEVKKKAAPAERTRSLGSPSLIMAKNREKEKASGGSANCIESASFDSGSDATSDSDGISRSGSEDLHRHARTRGDPKNTGTSKNAVDTSSSITAIPSSAITPLTTTLNIGRDYWAGSSPPAGAQVRTKLPIVSSSASAAHLRGSTVPQPEIWSQDERELKRQRRKQSNRESARRSRLRKQAEYDDLAVRVGSLTGENNRLREELTRLRGDCEKLAAENASLSEKLNAKPIVEDLGEAGS